MNTHIHTHTHTHTYRSWHTDLTHLHRFAMFRLVKNNALLNHRRTTWLWTTIFQDTLRRLVGEGDTGSLLQEHTKTFLNLGPLVWTQKAFDQDFSPFFIEVSRLSTTTTPLPFSIFSSAVSNSGGAVQTKCGRDCCCISFAGVESLLNHLMR